MQDSGDLTLVTGGAGFIGSHSVEALLASGRRVRVLDNFSTGRRERLPAAHPQLDIVEGDIRDRPAVEAAMRGATSVLHLAAQIFVQVSIEDPVNSCQQNVLGFVTVLDCARRAAVRRVVYASSAAVYGTPVALPLTEDSPLAPLSPYGLEKRINEQYAELFRSLYGLNSLGLRYFNVYGPRQDPASPYSGVISKFVRAADEGLPVRIFGDGLQTRDFVFVKDIARANVAALSRDGQGVCNVGTGESVTLLQMVDALEACCGKKLERRFEPPAVGDIRESRMSPARLEQWLGSRPAVPLRTGLAELIAG